MQLSESASSTNRIRDEANAQVQLAITGMIDTPRAKYNQICKLMEVISFTSRWALGKRKIPDRTVSYYKLSHKLVPTLHETIELETS